MRQESRYRADVKSAAAARGLMQFISSTSDKIADELGRENFRQDELYNPPTADFVRLAVFIRSVQAISRISRRRLRQATTAAKTIWRAGWRVPNPICPTDTFPKSSFRRSKDYVYKVMANYRVYQMLYNENLKTR